MILPRRHLDYVLAKDMSDDDLRHFDLWIRTYKGKFEKWANNEQICFSYEVYQEWYIHRQNELLLDKLKQLMEIHNS